MRSMMVAAAFAMAAVPAFAQERHDITQMSCEQVQQIVESEGVAILSYTSSGILGLSRYDRYVASQQYCNSGEVVRKTGVPTQDQKYCPVRKCVESSIFVSG